CEEIMQLQYINLILAIETASSIRGAAVILGKSQPAVSKALRQAEADLGVVIFERGPRGVVPTRDGQVVLRRAHVIKDEMRRLQDEVAQLRGDLTGDLTVTVSPLAATRLIPPVMRRFRTRFPAIHVQINAGNAPSAFRPLREGQCDIVIGPAPQADEATGLTVTRLFRAPISVITGRNSRYAAARSLDELKDADWLLIGPKDRRPVFAQHFTAMGVKAPVPLTTSDSVIALLSMIEDSDLCATFPTPSIEELEARWRISKIALEEEIKPLPIAICIASLRPLTPAAQFFHDCMCDAAGQLDGVLRP
ncbi:MAG: LysR family transcriptional regulator, partial [Desulfobacterales bacterium]|nr:LysR family transcriptional regulator [Desulfobacterales bacterium]